MYYDYLSIQTRTNNDKLLEKINDDSCVEKDLEDWAEEINKNVTYRDYLSTHFDTINLYYKSIKHYGLLKDYTNELLLIKLSLKDYCNTNELNNIAQILNDVIIDFEYFTEQFNKMRLRENKMKRINKQTNYW